MAKFQVNVLLSADSTLDTFRVADAAGAGNQLTKLDNGKFLRLKGDSQMGLCAAGDEIEAVLIAGDTMAPQDAFNLGAVQVEGRVKVVFDGLQGTPGTGSIAVGDFVVCGSVDARGVALSTSAPKVCKATAAPAGIVFTWRVLSILTGSGGVGSTGVIEAL